MAADTGDSRGANASELLAVEEQMEQNISDFEAFEAQQLVIETEHNEIDSSFERSEAATIVNPEAESDDSGDDSKSPTVPSDAEVKLPPQRSTRSLSNAPATGEQHLLEGTVHQQPGGNILAEVLRCSSKDPPAPETEENEPHFLLPSHVDASTSDKNGSETEMQSQPHDLNPRQENSSEQFDESIKEELHVEATVLANPQHQSNTENMETGVDTSGLEAHPADDQETTEAVSSPNAVANPSEHDKIGVSTAKEDGSATAENNAEMPTFNPQQDGGPKQLDIVMEEEPNVDIVVLANPLHQSNTVELEAGALDSPVIVVARTAAPADQNMPDSVPSPETAATPSDHDKAVGIAKRMDSKNWPQRPDIQLIVNEIKKPTRPPNDAKADNDADEENYCLRCCCWPCFGHCKCKGKACELGYKCTKKDREVLARGIVSVFQYWTDGFTPRWKFLWMVAKIILYFGLTVVLAVLFVIDYHQGENIVFDCISFGFSCWGFLVSFFYTLYFCIRRRREFCITIRDFCCFAIPKFCTCTALFFYKCFCCFCTIKCVKKEEKQKKPEEEEKQKKPEENKKKDKQKEKHEKAEKYVSDMQKFKPAQNSFEKFTALVGNTSEVLLTIVDDVILTVVFILSLYSFIGKQRFTQFYGSVRAGSIIAFIALVLSTLKLIVFGHGLRLISIAMNVRALDKKIEMDSDDMEVKLPNKFIRYFLSFQSRLVFHVVASSAFQLCGIFALSWKIIQDSCSAVAAPSLPTGNWTNGSYTSLVSGAPFTCNLHPMVNGFTIYNILYIAIVPTLLGYTSFFVCNTPWLVEYMRTITMWSYFNMACTAGCRVRTKRENDKVARGGKVAGCCVRFKNCVLCKNCGQDKVGTDGGQVEVIEDGGGQSEVCQDGGGQDEDPQLCKVSDKDAYMSPMLQLIRLFGGNLLCNVTAEELREVGANAERERQAILEDHNRDAVKFGTNFVSRAVTMLGQALFLGPAAIIGVLQVILFIVHLSFMGCCINGDVHTVFSPSVLTDAAVVFVPLMFLFLLISAPGPWMGLFWISVVVGIIATVAALVASVVAIMALALLLCALVVCLGSSSSRRN